MIYSKLNFRFTLFICFIAFLPNWTMAQCEEVADIESIPACDGSVTVIWVPSGPVESYTLEVFDPMNPDQVVYTSNTLDTIINIPAETLTPGVSYSILVTSNCELNDASQDGFISSEDIRHPVPVISISEVVYPSCEGEPNGSFDVTILDDCGASYNIIVGDQVFSSVPSGAPVTFTGLSGSPEGITHAVRIEVVEFANCLFSFSPFGLVSYIVFFC